VGGEALNDESLAQGLTVVDRYRHAMDEAFGKNTALAGALLTLIEQLGNVRLGVLAEQLNGGSRGRGPAGIGAVHIGRPLFASVFKASWSARRVAYLG
jgi:hypothetical protein